MFAFPVVAHRQETTAFARLLNFLVGAWNADYGVYAVSVNLYFPDK